MPTCVTWKDSRGLELRRELRAREFERVPSALSLFVFLSLLHLLFLVLLAILQRLHLLLMLLLQLLAIVLVGLLLGLLILRLEMNAGRKETAPLMKLMRATRPGGSASAADAERTPANREKGTGVVFRRHPDVGGRTTPVPFFRSENRLFSGETGDSTSAKKRLPSPFSGFDLTGFSHV
jgi:hypothetical protein